MLQNFNFWVNMKQTFPLSFAHPCVFAYKGWCFYFFTYSGSELVDFFQAHNLCTVCLNDWNRCMDYIMAPHAAVRSKRI